MLPKHNSLGCRSQCTTLQVGQPAAPPRQTPLQQKRARCVQASALGDLFRSMFDFESWAPKSTRIWRLQQYQPGGSEAQGTEAAPTDSPDAMSVLSDRINQLRDTGPTTNSGSSNSSSAAVLDPPSTSSSSTSNAADSSSNLAAAADGAGEASAVKSFTDADDDELSAALGQRIKQIVSTTGSQGSSMDEEEMRQPLTGGEIRQLLLKKYGKLYDMSFVRRDVPGMKTFVCLNIMWLHLEQQSFKMSAEQYMEKLQSVAALVNVLGQTDKVRAFLEAPAKSQKGLPRRPVVGTAISIRFDLDQAVIDEWFGQGYD